MKDLKINKNNVIPAFLLMTNAFNYSLKEGIDKTEFKSASFKEKVELLKSRFEKNLIDCRKDLEICLENEVYSGETLDWVKEMIVISKAIESTCKKKKGKKADSTVLFNCFLHNDSNPSMSWSATQHGFYCFGCSKDNKVFDLFDYLTVSQKLTGPDSFKRAFAIAAEVMVKDGHKIKNPFFEKISDSRHSNYIPFSKEMNKVRHWTFLYPIENDLPALKKLEERGISQGTAKRMSIMTWYPTMDNQAYGLCYWVFINDNGSYTRRLATINKSQYPKGFGEPLKWWNPKNKGMGIFNTRVLEHCRQFQEVCFVTESAIDAMSCEELGYHAVGLNSISNLSLFFKEYVDKQPDTMLICLTDNDTAGKSVIDSFRNRNLYVPEYLKVGYTEDSWLSKYKDINEALISDREETLKGLKEIEKKAKDFYGGMKNG